MDTLVTWEEQDFLLKVGVVTTEAERNECLRLRYGEYHDKQGSVPFSPDRLECDWADPHSVLLCTKMGQDQKVLGTMRLIHARDACILTHGYGCSTKDRGSEPVQFSGRSFELPSLNPRTGLPVRLDETVEGSRYVAHQIPLPDGASVLHSVALLEAGFRYCAANGIKQIVGALRDHHFHSLRAIGWDAIELMPREDGAAHQYHGMPYRVVFFPVPQVGNQYYNGVRVAKP